MYKKKYCRSFLLRAIVILGSIIIFSRDQALHTKEIQSATTKRGEREVRGEYFLWE